ncbi:DUF5133 domain-containing protein [Streptomyces anandii]|uniref:DUF5133 domain-containing protein n=1 Tax=Streptomyces anandii TaxID=285454 RepID=UPI0036B8F741
MPHPEFLRGLLDEYEAVLAEERRTAASGRSTRAQDLAYTLCVSTGTRSVGPALEAARRMLEAAAAPRTEKTPRTPRARASHTRTVRPPVNRGAEAAGDATVAPRASLPGRVPAGTVVPAGTAAPAGAVVPAAGTEPQPA